MTKRNSIKEDTEVFVWEEGYLDDTVDGGNKVRLYQKIGDELHPESDHMIKTVDGQIWPYSHAIPVTEFGCPKCKAKYSDNKTGLVLGKEAKDSKEERLVVEGYTGACMVCDEDFYLFELLKNNDYVS